ncbi:MAG: laccase domain-containing protein, partial [Geminicoccaceae bacterium]
GDHIKAAVGPCIAKPSYQVGLDMLAAFERQDPSGTSLFEAEPDSERFLFDLKAYVLTRLARSGVKDLTALLQDTLTDEAQFFSARRARSRGRERFGLLLSAIAIEHRASNVGAPGMRSTASAGNNDQP